MAHVLDTDAFIAKLKAIIHRPRWAEKLFPSYMGWRTSAVINAATARGTAANRARGIYPVPLSVYLDIAAKGTPAETLLQFLRSEADVIAAAAAKARAFAAVTFDKDGYNSLDPAHRPRSLWAFLHDDLHRPLDKEETHRRRYLPSRSARYLWTGPRFSLGFSLLDSLASPGHRRLLREFMGGIAAVFPRGFNCESALRSVLKAVSAFAKVNGDFFPAWRILVSLDNLGGYLPAPPAADFIEDVTAWVSGDLVEPGTYLPGWADLFDHGVDRFVRDVPEVRPTSSFYEYVASWDWARPGAVDDRFPFEVTIGRDEKPIPVRRTKDMLSLYLTVDEIYQLAIKPAARPARAMVKRETGKSRAVLITDFPLYLQMSWLGYDLERAMRRVPSTSLFFSGSEQAKLWLEMGADSRNLGLWKMPLDQSKFDHNISLRMIGVVLDRIRALLVTPEQRMVLDLIKDSLVVNPTVVTVGDVSIPITKGILSGWRWTALLDTWINFSQVYASLAWLRANASAPEFSSLGLYTQGDDVRFICMNPSLAIALCEVMIKAGFDINPGKTWLSPVRDEYLRQVSGLDGVYGYLTRCINSIIWRNPIKPEPYGWVEGVRSAASRWDMAYSRGAVLQSVRKHLRKEVTNLTPNAERLGHALSMIAAPPYLGGLDLPYLLDPKDLSYGSFFRLKVDQVSRILNLGVAPGLRQMHDAVCQKFGLPTFYSDLEALARDKVNPFADNISKPVWDDARVTATPVSEVAPRTPPVCPASSLIPSRAVFSVKGFPLWVLRAAVLRLAKEKDFLSVLPLLRTDCAVHSEYIRRGHGNATWFSWITGQLDLPVRAFPNWGPGFLGGVVGPKKSNYLRRCLTRASPYRGSNRVALESGFYHSQRLPSSYLPVRVGA